MDSRRAGRSACCSYMSSTGSRFTGAWTCTFRWRRSRASATGWLEDAQKHPLGFQITFFRARVADTRGNPSAFAAEHLIVAHAALSDPRRGRLAHAQQVARAGFGLAGAARDATDVKAHKWLL